MDKMDWVRHYTKPTEDRLQGRNATHFERALVLGAHGGAVSAVNLLTLGALRRRAIEAGRRRE